MTTEQPEPGVETTTHDEPEDAGCPDDIHAVLAADDSGDDGEPDYEDVTVDAGDDQPEGAA